jgi:hypothetical protein
MARIAGGLTSSTCETVAVGDASDPLAELAAGIAFWRSRSPWPADFHNGDYKLWRLENPHGDFTLTWWKPFLRRLHDWIADRPTTHAVLTTNFERAIPDLAAAWRGSCEPCLDADISTVRWDQVKGFPEVVTTIKPLKWPSPVFTSKFCHFLLPRIFPVVDNEGSGNHWPYYQQYFHHVQSLWDVTPDEVRTALIASMTEAVESAGAKLDPGFPMVTKIVELRLIGRQHQHP